MKRKILASITFAFLVTSCGGAPAETPVSSRVPGDDGWVLHVTDIPETPESEYNIEFDFFTTDRNGRANYFHGSYLQRAKGTVNGVSVDNFIKVKKGDGYFHTRGAYCRYLRIYVWKTGEETAVPSVYTTGDIFQKGETEATLSKTERSDQIIYEVSTMEGKFRLENNSDYDLYLGWVMSLG